MTSAKGTALALLYFAVAFLPAAHLDAADAFRDGVRAHLDKRYADSRRVFSGLAAAGDARAQFMMGAIFEQGFGVEKDLSTAARWYEKAGRNGNASAQYNLGIFYQFGKGVPKDERTAASWLLKAATQGHGRARNNLSTFYFTGIGVDRDLAEAWKWLTLSADRLKGKAREIALRNRAVIEREMTPDLIAQAKKRTNDWRGAEGR